MLNGRILHIMVCVILLTPNKLESLRITNPRLVYSASLKTPSFNFFSNLLNRLTNSSKESYKRAKIELFVNDTNKRLEGKPVRLLIVLEQSELFKRCNSLSYSNDGSEVKFSDNDKVLLPESFFEFCRSTDNNIPFQFLIHKVHFPETLDVSNYVNISKPINTPSMSFNLLRKDPNSPKELDVPKESNLPTTKQDYISSNELSKECVSCASIEFRADENYIYVPKWILDNLNLKPFDLVVLETVKLEDCTNVELKCLDKEFYDIGDIKNVLEERLKYYSTLTLNSVIPITVGDKTYKFKVVRLDTTKRQNANFASIQDIDINLKLL